MINRLIDALAEGFSNGYVRPLPVRDPEAETRIPAIVRHALEKHRGGESKDDYPYIKFAALSSTLDDDNDSVDVSIELGVYAAEGMEEGIAWLHTLGEMVKVYLTDRPIVDDRFQRTGPISLDIPDVDLQPFPYFYGKVTVSFTYRFVQQKNNVSLKEISAGPGGDV